MATLPENEREIVAILMDEFDAHLVEDPDEQIPETQATLFAA
jgi:hypothetical protein